MNGISKAGTDYQAWLKQIPVAKNNAPTDSFKVTQEGTQSSARTDVFENSGTAYTDFKPKTLTLGGWDDETFTAEDALMAQFNHRNRISIEDIMAGNIKNLKLGERLNEVEELRKKFQTEGLEKEIDWGKVESDLMGLSFEKNTCIDSNGIKVISIDKDELYKKIDYVASRYTVLKKRIEENFSGDELKEQLTMLDTVINDKKELIADSYSKLTGGFFDDMGMSEETKKIYNSVYDILNMQIEKYNEFIQNNKDYIDLKDSPDQWLKQDDAFMAAALRDAAKFSNKTTSDQLNTNASNYTLNDLTVMGTYVKECANQLNGYGIRVPYVDEETLGIQLAFQAMKVDTLANKSGISMNMSQTIKQSINGYNEEMIKYMQEVETKFRENPKFPEDYYRFGALEESAIENTYDYVMELYYKKDVATALSSGLEYGRKIFQNKCKDENYNVNYRYDETKNIQWTYLTNGPEGYFHGSSTLESYISNWNSFMDDLTSGSSENINLYFDKLIGVGNLTWPKHLVDIYA